MIKIENTKFEKFLKYISVEKVNEQLVIEFTENGIEANVFSIDHTLAVIATLKKEDFIEYENINKKVGIKNVESLINIMKVLSNDVELNVIEENNTEFLSVVSDKTKATVSVADIDSIETKLDPKFKTMILEKDTNFVSLDRSTINKLSSIIGSVEKLTKLTIKDNVLNVLMGSSSIVTINNTIENFEHVDEKGTYGVKISNVLKTIKDEDVSLCVIEGNLILRVEKYNSLVLLASEE